MRVQQSQMFCRHNSRVSVDLRHYCKLLKQNQYRVVRQGPCCPKSDSCPEVDPSAPDLGGGYTNDCMFWSDKCSLLKVSRLASKIR